MGWIEKDGTRYFRFTKTVGRTLNKNGVEVPVKKEFYGRTKKEAEQKYHDYVSKATAGLSTDRLYFGILSEEWISSFFMHDPNLKGSTKAQYLANWNRIIKSAPFYNYPLDSVKPKTIQSHYNNLAAQGVPADSIRLANLLMKRFYKYVEVESLGRNVTASLVIPKAQHTGESQDIVVWDDDEILKIFNGFDKADSRFRFKLLIVIAYYTGCRIGEILGLTYADISDKTLSVSKQLSRDFELLDDGTTKTVYKINTPKTRNSIRLIPLNENVTAALNEHKAWHFEEQLKNHYKSDYIFTTASGKLYDPTNIRTALNRYYKKIGVEAKTIHAYRHTFGTNLCRQGVPIQTASKLMGHESISTTARYYVNVSLPEKAAAIAALRSPEENCAQKVGRKSGNEEFSLDSEQIKKLETVEISSLLAPPLGIEPRTNL